MDRNVDLTWIIRHEERKDSQIIEIIAVMSIMIENYLPTGFLWTFLFSLRETSRTWRLMN